MPDYKTTSYGIEVLNRKHDKPFFLAVGLVKPHMPFSVPKKWFDMFPLDSIELPPHRDGDLDDVPAAGVRMAKPDGDHAAMLKSGRWKEAVQAYLATIAFCDAQVGRLLDALEKSAYRDNTIICLWSDHGWSLGEKEHWRKFALWEEPTRTVFIWKVPGMTPAGVLSPRPVDFMSIYPTLCTLTGMPRPAHVEGLDISPLLKDSDGVLGHSRAHDVSQKQPQLSQRAMALHPLRRRQRGTVQPRQRSVRMDERCRRCALRGYQDGFCETHPGGQRTRTADGQSWQRRKEESGRSAEQGQTEQTDQGCVLILFVLTNGDALLTGSPHGPARRSGCPS